MRSVLNREQFAVNNKVVILSDSEGSFKRDK
jgi:hypothetical protein